MAHIFEIIAVSILYLLVLGLGMLAAWKYKTCRRDTKREDLILAGRSMGFIIGSLGITATLTGGSYLSGSAETVYAHGLLWCQVPMCYALSLIIGGTFFAKKMRRDGCLTLVDPFFQRYGRVMGCLLCVIALVADIAFAAATLSHLGAMWTLLVEVQSLGIIITACVIIAYTVTGGLYSVVINDMVRIILVICGLVLCLVFASVHPAVDVTEFANGNWLKMKPQGLEWGYWVDALLLLVLGGIPWQVYFQRILSAKSVRCAQAISYISAFGCIVIGTPAVMLGAIASATNWNQTSWPGSIPIPASDTALILPMTMMYLCPRWAAVVGFVAIMAGAMSVADSAFLSAASLLNCAVYHLRLQASEREMAVVMRISIFVFGLIATLFAIFSSTIYGFWYFSSDLVYVVLFPQLVSALYIKFSNSYGSLAGYVISIVLRFLGGEPILGLPPTIMYPFYDNGNYTQNFPHRTFTMLISFGTIMLVSYVTKILFERRVLPRKLDIFQCITNKQIHSTRDETKMDETGIQSDLHKYADK